jgi:archaellum biogenesis ATPase FlaH
MKQELLQLLLNKDFYRNNKHRIYPSLFDGSDLKPLYNTIVDAHEQFDSDLTVTDVEALYDIKNPALNEVKKANVKMLLREIASRTGMTAEVAEEVLAETYKQKVGGEVAQIGIRMEDGEIKDLLPLKKLIDKVGDTISYQEQITHCSTDVDELLKDTSDENRWLFNIRSLKNKVPGIGAGELCIIFARPETGKTASHISLCYGPGGFAEQGASVHTMVNEEPAKRTMLRAISAWTGMSRQEIEQDAQFARDEWANVKDNVNMFDAQGVSIDEVDAYCERHKPDVLVIDQLDKVQVNGMFQRTDEKLREIYTQAREIAKRHSLALIAVSQASAEAQGKTILNPSEMEGSKTGKFAEADVIIGIGCHAVGMDEEPDYTRHLTVGKNKITGWHGTIVCLIEPRVSRYVD